MGDRLPFGLSLFALVFQYPLGIQALIGGIGSVGVSINAAIIILSGPLNEGATAEPDAIVDVVTDASRHIVSTIATTFGGFALILEGSQFWPPSPWRCRRRAAQPSPFYPAPPLHFADASGRHFLKPTHHNTPEPPVALREVA